jgi:hypothetical protein
MDLPRIAFSTKRLTTNRGRALVRAITYAQFQWSRRRSHSRIPWRRIGRICLGIASPFIVIAIFALGAVFGWPVMLAAISVLGAVVIWPDRHELPQRLAALRPANVVPKDASTLVKILCYVTQISDENTLWNELWRAWYWTRGSVAILVVVGGLIAVEELFGIAAMFIAMMVVLLLLSQQNGGGVSAEEAAFLLGDSALPPPGKPQLPPSGTPQIGRSSTAIAPSRPGPVARR